MAEDVPAPRGREASGAAPREERTIEQPVLVEVLRNGIVESCHRGAVAVLDAGGEVRYAAGDIYLPVFVRSSIKPLQAVSLVESGALERFALQDSHLALACASHNGEPGHIGVVAAWLEHLGLHCESLECGAEWPCETAARALAAGGERPRRWHHNCSGKHAGMLSCCLHLGLPTVGYTQADHPLHRHWQGILEELTDVSLEGLPAGTDGCGLPAPALPLASLALAFARIATPAGLSPQRSAALTRIRAAMLAHPFLVAGSGRCCTRLLESGILAKMGAEGVYAAALPEAGIGIALKIEDGAARAAQVVLCALLAAVGLEPDPALRSPALHDSRGMVVGSLRPAPGWRPLLQ